MQGVMLGFATISVVIAVGAFLAQVKVLDQSAQLVLSKVTFFVASPALMVSTLAHADVGQVISENLVASFAGVAVAAGTYAVLARTIWHRSLGEGAIGAMCSAYVNAGNLGIPIATYALGSAAYVAPTLLVQLLLLQPIALAVLDVDRVGRFSWSTVLSRPLRNPLTVGSLLGLLLALTGWRLPAPVRDPLDLVGACAVPCALLAYGVALRLGPGPASGGSSVELATTTALKLLAQPVVAGAAAAGVLGVRGHTLLAIVVCSALPTAQNVFVHATRYGRATVLARDAILLSTIGAVPVIFLAVLILG